MLLKKVQNETLRHVRLWKKVFGSSCFIVSLLINEVIGYFLSAVTPIYFFAWKLNKAFFSLSC